MRKQKYKSPIKTKPLRRPGQSLATKNINLILDNIYYYLFLAIMFSCFAFFEWLHWLQIMPITPWFYTMFALVSIGLFIFKYMKISKVIQRNKQGLDGEREVGELLEKLRINGHEVFHDIVFVGFNVDHVVVCKKGIFCIETKTYSKPAKGETKLTFDGETLTVNGFRSKAPIIQVKAASKSIQELVEQTSGKKCYVRPVLLFPGWFVDSKNKINENDIWALHPKGFSVFVSNSQDCLSEDDVNLIANHLANYIRSL